MVIGITNRALCACGFLKQLQKIGMGRPDLIILRERDLDEASYEKLAKNCLNILKPYGVPLAIHTHTEIARKLHMGNLHLPLTKFKSSCEFNSVGTSVHSVEEALRSQELGANYLIAGHIFATDCKKGVPPRGCDFLHDVCRAVDIPVYAIGGISSENAQLTYASGARGVCIMSSLMSCENPIELINGLQNQI